LVQANILQKSPFSQSDDAYTTNPRDPGMRVVLPGTVGAEPSQYYVRVRSSSPNLDNLDGGQTTGRYQLQIRLRETNEVPGSTVRYADIRYATAGVDIRGQVAHSPLSGEASEGDENGNNTIGGAQELGNLLNTDRAALSIGGRLIGDDDVDFYEFDINYDSIQSIAGYDFANHLSTIFDLDYSDQFGRSDASIYVFDQDFNLVLVSDGVSGSSNSNIADDQSKPLDGADVDDLSRGSAGTLDPYIGAQALPSGTYYLAVTNANRIPTDMGQYVSENPSNPLTRMEPINSIVRIAEDRIGAAGGSLIAAGPVVPEFIDVDPNDGTDVGIIPFNLNDVTLFVSVDGPYLSGNFGAHVLTVDPFNGEVESVLGNLTGAGSPFVGDIGMRYDGGLFSFSQNYVGGGTPSDANVGDFLQIDPGTAAVAVLNDDGILTYELDPDGNTVRSPDIGNNNAGVGVFFEAMAFEGNGPRDLYAVGWRGDSVFFEGDSPAELDTNIIYRFETDTGIATSSPAPNRTNNSEWQGAGTQIRERGQIVTQAGEIIAVDATDPLAPWDPDFSIQDGTSVDVRVNNFFFGETFEFDTGPEVEVAVDQATGLVIRDGQFMILDGDFFQFDTGYSLVLPADTPGAAAGSFIADGLVFSLTDTQGVPFTIEFNDITTGGDGISAQFALDYTVDTTQAQLQQQLVNLINNGIPFDITATPIGTAPGVVSVALSEESLVEIFGQIQVDVQTSPITTLLQNSAPQVVAETLLIPDAGFVDGQTLFISDGQTDLQFEFDDDSSLVDPTAILIDITPGAVPTSQYVGLQIWQAFIDNDARLLPSLDTGTFPGAAALHIQTAVELSGELGDAPIVEIPRAAVITDGDQFSISSIDGDVVFEFDQLGGPTPGVSAGVVPVYYSPFDTPAIVATAVWDAVNAYTAIEATLVNEYVVFNGQQVPLGHTGPAPATPHATFVNLGSPLQVQDLWDYESDNADPPTFDQIDGFLRGFDEAQSMAQVQAQLAQELNTARQIDDASNPANGQIRITAVDDHEFGLKTGDSVIIRGVNGQVYANGLYDITIVDADEFDLVGTQFRSNAGDALFDYTDDDQGVFLNYEASSRGVRTNFLGANTAMFDGVPIFTDQGTMGGIGGSTFFTTRVPVRAAELANEVADTLALFINREFFPRGTAAAVGDTVSLSNLEVTSIDAPLTATSAGSGGRVTGIDFIGGVMYAVDDAGGFYAVTGYTGFNAQTESIADFGVEFAGLTAGPPQLENGAYSDILFGITTDGNILAFDTQGVLQPVFADGQAVLDTGVTGTVNGLAFSNLDKNLWHVTTNRRGDAGHGIDVPVDGSRLNVEGGSSLYFGFQNPNANGWSRLDPENRNDYNFPGGAHGSVVSNPFSLSRYSASDDPVLYFNYFLETDGIDYDLTNDQYFGNPKGKSDTLRVFIGDEDGNWQLLATNNEFRDDVRLDEYELGDGAIVSLEDEVGARRGIQELYDNTGSWRQARIQLGPWAGQEDLVLKFEFATAGAIDLGGTGGVEITGVAAEKIVDGQLVVIDGFDVFEFDLGHTLIAQAASNITDGSQFIVDGVTYEFDLGGAPPTTAVPIALNGDEDAATVADAVRDALVANGNTVEIVDNRINLPLLPNLADVQLLDDGLLQTGVPGVTGTNRPMVVTLEMTGTEVAAVVRQALEDEYAGGDADGFQSVKQYRNVVTLVNHTVDDPGPLRLAAFQAADLFGSFHTANPSKPGVDNAHEGAYIDDIIIGFAERGEMVTNPTGNATFQDSPYVPDFSTLTGTYQLEIRRGPDYGLSLDVPPFYCTVPGIPPFGCGGRAFDTNDRLTQGVSLRAPSALEVYDGQQFHISDGVDTVIFEYDDVDLGDGANFGDGVTSGVIAVPFDTTRVQPNGDLNAETSAQMAAKIRDLINGSQVQAVLDVQASLSEGSGGALGITTSNVIDLFGNATGTLDPYSDRVVPTFDFGEIEVITYGYSQRLLAPEPTPEYTMVGDTNLFRDQGQILIHSNFIRDSLQYGIIADAGARNRSDLVPDAGTLPHAGPVRNTRVENLDRLVPGPVLENNVISGSGTAGILVSGDPNSGTGELASVAFSRVVNNTIYGTGSGDGIRVTQNAAPTVLNTILANVSRGLVIDGSSTPQTELGGLLFQDVGTLSTNGQLGAYPIVLGSNDPLFVDPANDNFLLAENSPAIDSSIDSLEDRQDLVFVKDPLGISESPILAPETDVFGQLRVDDPLVATPAGQGSNVFKDRGAVDRVDFTGLVAVLSNPLDNDANDVSDQFTVVATEVTLDNFSIVLTDSGTGADDTSVSSSNVTLLRDGRTLVAGVDFSFAYDPTSNTIRLAPIAGIWPSNRQFDIDLANRDRTNLSFVDSTPVDGATLVITDAQSPANIEEFEYDTGFILTVPSAGGAVIMDTETFSITHDDETFVFEFDSDNDYDDVNNVQVPFTDTMNRSAVADAMVAAIESTTLTLTPLNVGSGRVHIGGDSTTLLDTSNTIVSQTGQPGIGSATATAIAVVPGMASDVASATAAAIAASTLVGVDADAFGWEVFLTGAASIVGPGLTIEQVTPIRDRAGNELQASRANETTRFTVLTGLGVDFGDAPSQYPVLTEDGGASHSISEGYRLGPAIFPSADGIPSPNADADAGDDGVAFTEFNAGAQAAVDVTAFGISGERPGLLDAWIDYNADGDWDDAGEQIFSSEPLVNGTNPLTFTIDGDAAAGTTFARFRLSSSGGLSPGGAASDGEVEDYQVTIQGNPWHNYANGADTNGDTFVSPIDALLVIFLLNNAEDMGIDLSEPLPVPPLPEFAPPPYYDVNRDGFVSPQDALIVISILNGDGEGESGAEGEGYGLAANSSSGLLDGDDLGSGLPVGGALLAGSFSSETSQMNSLQATTLQANSTTVTNPPLIGTPAETDPRAVALRSNFADEDLEDLLDEISDELDGDAHEAIFASFDV
jgi:hypothetical protein